MIDARRWGRFDLVVLPPAFPYGGMENPNLTFVTPTLIVGDRSQASVVIHELAHSWTGNSVTNATWEHFWLNEGCTMYAQRMLLGALYGRPEAELDAAVGAAALGEVVRRLGPTHAHTALVLSLGEEDPDLSSTRVPYEKGYGLLAHLAGVVGEAAFGDFFRAYLARYRLACVTTDDFRGFFAAYFGDAGAGFAWDEWLYAPGPCPSPVAVACALSSDAAAFADKWVRRGGVSDARPYHNFSPPQRLAFLDRLFEEAERLDGERAIIKPSVLRRMEAEYHLSESRNAEVRFRWYRLCLRSGLAEVVPGVVGFLQEQGRMKYVIPLYRELARVEVGRAAAITCFAGARAAYHGVCVRKVEAELARALERPAVDPSTYVCVCVCGGVLGQP